MKAVEKTIVKKVEWFSNSAEMTLICVNETGNLRYASVLNLPSDCLNKVLSDLQKQAPEVDINECLKIEQWSETDINFVFDFSALENQEFTFTRNVLEIDYRQIRA
jgi:hypothetical protein